VTTRSMANFKIYISGNLKKP